MVWQQWMFVVWYVVNIILTIASIDKQRDPIDGPTGAWMVLVYVLLMWAVLSI